MQAPLAVRSYLLLADIQNTALSAFLIFSERVLYPTYAVQSRLWGISVLDDQAAAGAIMWVPGGGIFFTALLITFAAWLNNEDRKGQQFDQQQKEAAQ